MLAHAESASSPAAIAFCGATLVLDPSGALFWEEERLLAVADMHLEKGSSYARRGQLLPPFDTVETLARLEGAIRRYAPRTVAALGDSLHDPFAAGRMDREARARLAALARARTLIWIAGNHDPLAPAASEGARPLEGDHVAALSIGRLAFRHEPRPATADGADAPASGELCGHLHPVARVVQRGRAIRRRCFLGDGARMVLPAFGAFTGGLDVGHPAFAGLFPGGGTNGARGELLAHVLGAGRTYRIPAAALGR